ncbi:MAG: TonB-dependent hemoglobin/transferrin/lactoferrin family receptor [Polaromonas sp.]|nr:TonB-dependent hemoglobin/transferrin/lactoferrin family receptor [Polaromonas sp.]
MQPAVVLNCFQGFIVAALFLPALQAAPAAFSAASFFSTRFSAPFGVARLSLLAALACGWAFTAQAQIAAAGKPLGEVVVSGSRSEQLSDDLPMSLDVINAQALEENQVGDIRDAARYLPNVSVRRAPARFGLIGGGSDGRGGNEGFNIRGLDGNRVLLMVDGIRAPRSYVFSSYAFGRDSFSMDLVKRIEIIRGPSSVLYGSDGLAGLVNFITLEPADFLTPGRTLGGRASIGYSGDNRGVSASATVAGRASESVEWLLSASKGHAREMDNQGTNDAANADRTRPNPQTDDATALLGKLVLRPSAAQKHVLTLEHVEKKSAYDLLTARAKPPLAATSVLAGDALSTAERTRLTWDARYKIDGALVDNLQTVLGYQDAASRQYTFEDRNTSPDRVRDMTYDERTWQAGVQADKSFRLSPDWSHKLTYGVDYSRAEIVNLQTGQVPAAGETFPLKRFPDTTESSAALYLQDEFISERWSVTPGVRLDRFKLDASQAGFTGQAASLSGSAVSPKLGLLYRAAPAWSVFGNYASGFRAPNASQLNGYFENVTQFYKTISNPSLLPEKSRNLEVGLRGRLDRLTLDVAAFTGRFTNLIEDNVIVGGAGVVGNPTVFQSVNIGNATISGFEVKGVMDWGQLAGGRVSMPFGYGQTRGKNRDTGQALNSIDPAMLHLGLKYATPAWDVRLNAVRHSAKDGSDVSVQAPATQFVVPAATTLDVAGQWRISPTLRLNTGIANLTDRKHWNWSDVRGLSATTLVADAYSQPGRHLNVSLVADF